METLLRDLKIGVRLLAKKPAFTAAAVLMLAMGIAANTAIFSVVYATFFDPLPYRDAERLVMLWSRFEGHRYPASIREYVEWKRRATAFDDLNAWNGRQANLSTGPRPEQVQTGPATPGFLAMLGYGHPLALGRDFLEEEGTPGRDRVAILTHRMWRDRFGGDPAIIGREIRIDRKPFTVVGVLGAGPADENQNQLWVPLAFTPEQMNDDNHWLLVMGRLKPDTSIAQANAEIGAVSRAVGSEASAPRGEWTASVEPFRNNFLSADTKRGLWLLFGAVAFVLLIACANVANLLLARGAARQRELAIRTAIGASRTQIVRQLLVESIVLAASGGAMGVVLAAALLRVVVVLMPPYMLPTEAVVQLNVPVLLFTVTACGLCGVLFGAAPAWQARRINVNDLLKETARSVTSGGERLRHALVIVEFALALTLLTGGGLAIHSLLTLTNRDPGFRADHVLTFSVPAEQDRFSTPEQVTLFYRQLLSGVERLPGVVSASISTGMPLRQWGRTAFVVAGAPASDPSRRPYTSTSLVTPDYFNTFGITITRGRVFTDQDRTGAPAAAIVNETFAKRYLPNRDPLTARIVFPPPRPGPGRSEETEWHIVGVYADVAEISGAGESAPEVLLPFWQASWPRARVAIRTLGDPAALQPSAASILQSLDPDLPMADVQTMEQIVAQELVADRFNTMLFGSFALVGLVLAVFGVYSVMSFVIAQRSHEIAVRMALGAGRLVILRQMVQEGMMTALFGTAIGSVGAFYASKTLRGVITGVSEVGPGPFAAVTVTLLGAALLACVLPALRASSVDPMTTLRGE